MSLPEVMDSLGGAKVSDLVDQDVTEVGGWLSVAIYIGVALIWLDPDRRIESRLGD